MDNESFDVSRYLDDDNLDYGTPQLPNFAYPADRNESQGDQQKLPLLQLADWDPNLPYNESPPRCIHYSIEWKLLLRNGLRLPKLTSDTGQNLVLAPGAFWERTLKSKVEDLLKRSTPRS